MYENLCLESGYTCIGTCTWPIYKRDRLLAVVMGDKLRQTLACCSVVIWVSTNYP